MMLDIELDYICYSDNAWCFSTGYRKFNNEASTTYPGASVRLSSDPSQSYAVNSVTGQFAFAPE